jgi:hypothetical protein
MTVEVFPIGNSGLKCVLIQSDAIHGNNLFEVTLIKNGKVLEENGVDAHMDFQSEEEFLTFRSGVEELNLDLILHGSHSLLIQRILKETILSLPASQSRKQTLGKITQPNDELGDKKTLNPFVIFNRPAESAEEQNQLETKQSKNETKKPDNKIIRGF